MTARKKMQRVFDRWPTEIKSETCDDELIGKTIKYASTGYTKNDDFFMFFEFTDGMCMHSFLRFDKGPWPDHFPNPAKNK